jgi:hypothetical protein
MTQKKPDSWWSIEEVAVWIETRDRKFLKAARLKGASSAALDDLMGKLRGGSIRAFASVD